MNHSLPHIFKSPIIPATTDPMWEVQGLSSLPLIDTLVVTSPFAQGSAEELLLGKMMSACKLSIAEYHVVHLAQGQLVAWYQLREQCKVSKILLLGILPTQMGVSAMMLPHEVNLFDQAIWMPSASLSHLAQNDALRKHLWVNVFQKVYLSTT